MRFVNVLLVLAGLFFVLAAVQVALPAAPVFATALAAAKVVALGASAVLALFLGLCALAGTLEAFAGLLDL